VPGTKYGILAGYDGSKAATDAPHWAAREAAERETSLTLLFSSDLMPPGDQSLHTLAALARMEGEHDLARGLQYAESAAVARGARAELTGQPAAEALCERSADAVMVVLGARGHGRLPGLLLGSVPWKLAAHGHCRVVVVRGGWHPANGSRPVVTGIDGSAAASAAAAFAFEEAAFRRVSLVAVCALADHPGVFGATDRMAQECGDEVARLQDHYPDVEVSRRVVAGPPRSALLEAADTAQLVVIGSTGRTGIRGMHLGSVAQAVLHHSACPVGVIPSAALTVPAGLGRLASRGVEWQ
jgi:nucleotide-binding universal stress UspA family protein